MVMRRGSRGVASALSGQRIGPEWQSYRSQRRIGGGGRRKTKQREVAPYVLRCACEEAAVLPSCETEQVVADVVLFELGVQNLQWEPPIWMATQFLVVCTFGK
jgi:hypothetical protein